VKEIIVTDTDPEGDKFSLDPRFRVVSVAPSSARRSRGSTRNDGVSRLLY